MSECRRATLGRPVLAPDTSTLRHSALPQLPDPPSDSPDLRPELPDSSQIYAPRSTLGPAHIAPRSTLGPARSTPGCQVSTCRGVGVSTGHVGTRHSDTSTLRHSELSSVGVWTCGSVGVSECRLSECQRVGKNAKQAKCGSQFCFNRAPLAARYRLNQNRV